MWSDWTPSPSYPSSIYMAADCAPSGQGGPLTVADWVQVGRYALGLIPLAPLVVLPLTRRPASMPCPPRGGWRGTRTVRCSLAPPDSPAVKPAHGPGGHSPRWAGKAPSVHSALRPETVEVRQCESGGRRPADAVLNVNEKGTASGNLGVALMLPLPGTFKAGKQQILEFSFLPLAAGAAELTFSDQVATCEVATDKAVAVPAQFVNGSVLVQQ